MAFFNCWHFYIYEQDKFQAQLSLKMFFKPWAWSETPKTGLSCYEAKII